MVSVPEGGELGRETSSLLVPGSEASAQLSCTRLALVPRLSQEENSSCGSLVIKFSKIRRLLLPLICIKVAGKQYGGGRKCRKKETELKEKENERNRFKDMQIIN